MVDYYKTKEVQKMEERTSTIKKLELKKDDIISIVLFDKGLSGNDLKFLEDEFEFYKEDINNFTSNYKNIGVVFRLKAIKEEFLKDWKIFLQKVIRRSYGFDKFSNIFVSKGGDKILLITNKRLLSIDLKKLNEKIEETNYRIESYNDKISEEMKGLVEVAEEEPKGIFKKVMEVFRR